MKKIKVTTIISIISPIKEIVEMSVEKTVPGIKKKYQVNKSEIIPTEFDETKKKYMAHIELEILFENIKNIFEFIYDFSPASIEIESPEKVILNNFDLTSELNDLSGNLLLLTNQKLSLENSFRSCCESILSIIKEDSGTQKSQICEVLEILKKYYVPARSVELKKNE